MGAVWQRFQAIPRKHGYNRANRDAPHPSASMHHGFVREFSGKEPKAHAQRHPAQDPRTARPRTDGHLDRPDLGRHHHACTGDAAAGRVHQRPFGDQIGGRQFPCAAGGEPHGRAHRTSEHHGHRTVGHDVAQFAAPLAHPAHRPHQAEPRQRVPHCAHRRHAEVVCGAPWRRGAWRTPRVRAYAPAARRRSTTSAAMH